MNIRLLRLALGALLTLLLGATQAQPLTVGSKRFTESYLLGELVTQTLTGQGQAAVHRQGLGNTAILATALQQGQIDVYPEYTGTIVRELLKRDAAADAQAPLAQINAWLAPLGLKAAVPLGFNNSYALAMREDEAERLGIRTLSDLAARAPALKLGLSHEFIARADGWPALQRTYGLALKPGSGLDHGLAYQALASGNVDLIDVYTTDAQLARQPVRVLQDDKAFFPRYDAVLLMRAAVDERPLQSLAGQLPAARMIELNAAAEMEGRAFAEVARGFLQQAPAAARASFMTRLLAPDLPGLLAQHLALVLGSLALAVAVAVPLGIAAHRHAADPAVLGAAGLPDRMGGPHRLCAGAARAVRVCAAAHRAQHPCGAAGGTGRAATSRAGAWADTSPDAAGHRTAAGLAHADGRREDRRRHQCGHRHGGSLRGCRRAGRAHRGRAGRQ
jgi:osmoprotectant transport system permease protein